MWNVDFNVVVFTGYMLLAGRVRKAEEATVIQEVIKKHLKRTVSPETLFDVFANTSPTTVAMLQEVVGQSVDGFQHVVWTHSMRRLAVLIGQAIKFHEPVLLIGETGYVRMLFFKSLFTLL